MGDMGVMKATVAALALMNTRVRRLKLIYFQPYFWMEERFQSQFGHRKIVN